MPTTSPFAGPRSPASSVSRPSLALLGAEPLRAAYEYLSYRFDSETPAAAGGDGHPAVFFPGLASDSRAMAPLREHCAALGYTAIDWGRGFNTGPEGDFDVWLADLAAHSTELLAGHGPSATFVGWSLGGMYARELAKVMPGRTRQVITIGTPFNAEKDHTNVGWLFELLSGTEARIDAALAERLRTAPPLPTTSIYSRSDGVVAWQTCLHEQESPRIQDIEVHGSHLGMGWNPAVLRVVADRLAQRPGQWRPYAGAA